MTTMGTSTARPMCMVPVSRERTWSLRARRAASSVTEVRPAMEVPMLSAALRMVSTAAVSAAVPT